MSDYKKGIFKYPPYARASSSAVIVIDNSGSTEMEIGITDKSTRNRLTILDRHVMTASTYLSFFQEKGNYRIISCSAPPDHIAKGILSVGHQQMVRDGGARIYIQDFDNTEDAIEYLFTLEAIGTGLPFGSYRQQQLEDAITMARLSPEQIDVDFKNTPTGYAEIEFSAKNYENVLIVMDEPLTSSTFES